MIDFITSLHFDSPFWFIAMSAIPVMIYWQYFSNRPSEPALRFSTTKGLKNINNWKTKVYPYLPILLVMSVFCFVLALARPQLSLTEEKIKAEGIDIMMVMDLSSSMLSRDFDPDRLEVSKLVAREFVEKRIHDRIGLVVFSGESFTQCPLTTDHNILIDFLGNLEVGMLQDGTAIGMGLATAVNRLKDSQAKSKIIILLTDGVNNAGYINPNTAAEIAQQYGVKVYTIAVGSIGQALSPVNRRSDGEYMFAMANVEIDVELLQYISQLTGGKHFRAVDRVSLEEIYAEIDRLEKTEIEVNVFKRYKDEFRIFLYTGFVLLLTWWLFKQTVFRTFS